MPLPDTPADFCTAPINNNVFLAQSFSYRRSSETAQLGVDKTKSPMCFPSFDREV